MEENDKVTLTMSDGSKIVVRDPEWKEQVDPKRAAEYKRAQMETCRVVNEAAAEAQRRGVPLHEILPVS